MNVPDTLTVTLTEDQAFAVELAIVNQQVHDRLNGKPLDIDMAEAVTSIQYARGQRERRIDLERIRRYQPVTDHEPHCGCDDCWAQKILDTEPLEIDP